MDMGSAQSTVPSVRLPMLNNFVVCIPSPTEQQEIAKYLDQKCAEIDSLIALKQQKIEELKDYKKSIIYEYITGKKEVV
jgi:type I restriction enzyme S subunit